MIFLSWELLLFMLLKQATAENLCYTTLAGHPAAVKGCGKVKPPEEAAQDAGSGWQEAPPAREP